ncbi:hypothetical protein RH915_04815, partial [Serpentinicella sp. ANB-PHB4]|uniref:hypothetical protein n=1 Tax=Serpentinicella sp. ANB-PHB4 TaxID=3074076 RepID=UPI0028669938
LLTNGVTDPLEMKDNILDSVTPLSSLQNKTITGGLINAAEALNIGMGNAPVDPDPVDPDPVDPDPVDPDPVDPDPVDPDPIDPDPEDPDPVYEVVNGTATEHYVAGRLDYNGYLQMGAKYGYIASFNLYRLEGSDTWTDIAPE